MITFSIYTSKFQADVDINWHQQSISAGSSQRDHAARRLSQLADIEAVVGDRDDDRDVADRLNPYYRDYYRPARVYGSK